MTGARARVVFLLTNYKAGDELSGDRFARVYA